MTRAPVESARLRVLFLCTGNSCRSQMAEALTRWLRGDRVEAASAGVDPHGVDPRARAVLEELGIDVSGQRSKHVDELARTRFDHVITVCDHARETCPVWPAEARRHHVGFEDPPRLARGEADAEAALAHYRRVRDEIRAFVETLPDALADD